MCERRGVGAVADREIATLSAAQVQSSVQSVQQDETCACPRCGYDQRGVVGTWAEQCPLEGTCSECGLVFPWCEALRPEKFEPRWCVEFATGRVRVLWSCVRTLMRSLLPWRFWQRIKMSFALRPRRLALYFATLFVPAAVMYVVAQASVALYVRNEMQSRVREWNNSVPRFIEGLVLLKTRAQIGPWLVHPYEREMFESSMEWFEGLKAQPSARIDHSAIECIVEAVLFPLSSESWGEVLAARIAQPYVAPNQLWEFALGQQISSYAIEREILESMQLLGFLVFGTALCVVLPMAFVFLPVSRRKAGVRWRHFVRIVAYGAAIPLGIAYLLALSVLAGLLANAIDFGENLVQTFQGVLGFATLVAITVWWWSATRFYLRLPHAFLVVALLMILSSLFIFAIAFYAVEFNVLEAIG